MKTHPSRKPRYRFEKSEWFKAATDDGSDQDSELFVLWDEIKDADDVAHYDAVRGLINDVADIEWCVITFVRH